MAHDQTEFDKNEEREEDLKYEENVRAIREDGLAYEDFLHGDWTELPRYKQFAALEKALKRMDPSQMSTDFVRAPAINALQRRLIGLKKQDDEFWDFYSIVLALQIGFDEEFKDMINSVES